MGIGLIGENATGWKAERRNTKVGGLRGALFPFLQKKDKEVVKKELLEAIAPLDRGAAATAQDIARVDEVCGYPIPALPFPLILHHVCQG